MTAAKISLAFFKLNVPNMAEALAFWQTAFGFAVTMSFDEPDFIEHALALPDQKAGPSLLLVQTKTPRDVSVGAGHGPVGLVCDDIEAAHAAAIGAGATSENGVFEVTGGIKVAMLTAPQGHQIELVQLPS